MRLTSIIIERKIEPILIKKVKIILSGDGHNANPTIAASMK